jgi:macrolide transport system ATP-binding/permease protein
MRRVRAGLLRFRNLFRRDHLERELADELDTHVQMHTNDNIRAGMAPDEARRQAILALGGIEQTKERYRDRRAVPLLEAFLQDLRFGVRTLRKNPAFAFGAVGALAIGMGANVIIFSIANALILRPLPAANPEQLVRAYTGGFSNTSYAEYLESAIAARPCPDLPPFKASR